MYKEVCKRKHGAFFGVIIIVTVGFCLLSLPVWLRSFFMDGDFVGIEFFELAVLLLTCAVLYCYARTFMVGYTYSIIDDEIIIHKIVGRKEIPAAIVHLHQIIDIGRGSTMRSPEYNPRTAVRLYNVHDKKKITYIVYNNGAVHSLQFTPSDKLFKLISDKMLDKR